MGKGCDLGHRRFVKSLRQAAHVFELSPKSQGHHVRQIQQRRKVALRSVAPHCGSVVSLLIVAAGRLRNRYRRAFACCCPSRQSTHLVLGQTTAVETRVPSLLPPPRPALAACFVTYRSLFWIRDSSVGPIRHRLIGMRNNRHHRHSGGECKGQCENYS